MTINGNALNDQTDGQIKLYELRKVLNQNEI